MSYVERQIYWQLQLFKSVAKACKTPKKVDHLRVGYTRREEENVTGKGAEGEQERDIYTSIFYSIDNILNILE